MTRAKDISKILTDADISGNIDVDGTTNLDVVDVDGAVNFAADVTFADGADIITASAGTSNFIAGVNAGNSIQSGGNYNTVVGDEAGTALTTGDGNIAIGFEALSTEDAHGRNVAVGYRALKTLNAGAEGDNVGLGYQAGLSITEGVENIIIGSFAGDALTHADFNVAIGHAALGGDTQGSKSTAVGIKALKVQNFTSATDSMNTAVGFEAGTAVTTGIQNTLIGGLAGDALSDADKNVALGYLALSSDTQGSRSVAIGHSALNNQNFSSATDSNNVAVGFFAGEDITTGQYNTIVGSQAGEKVTTGSTNAYFGYNAGSTNITGGANVGIGIGALENATADFNTAIGKDSGSLISSGQKNTILGRFNGNQGGLDIRTNSNRIVLSDGDGNPRIYVDDAGNVAIGKVARAFNTTGVELRQGDDNQDSHFTVAGGTVCSFNRKTNDGPVINIGQDGTVEGQISISGTTVTYGGGHLGRWSRLLDNSKDTSIVKGTVMTNLDEMVEWGDEENEQLNKMAISSVEGDANVSGVFVSWDNDDDYNDMMIGMTGDMVIRIAQGTTVARGDLLMSAGDGTAKTQDDDIVRSKTIAKVTSTNVSHTYDDGTYLVPCVLMAC
jgi:hypothetical protein